MLIFYLKNFQVKLLPESNIQVPRHLLDRSPVSVRRLFMDDCCLTATKLVDLQDVSKVASEFMDWLRLKVNSLRSRALV